MGLVLTVISSALKSVSFDEVRTVFSSIMEDRIDPSIFPIDNSPFIDSDIFSVI
jgi:prephenate dehydratase